MRDWLLVAAGIFGPFLFGTAWCSLACWFLRDR